MTNKRELKRAINYICSDLFAECVAASLYSTKSHQENVDALLHSILLIHDDCIRRISHPEPGLKPKVYYKNLVENFNKQVSEIVDHIGNLA